MMHATRLLLAMLPLTACADAARLTEPPLDRAEARATTGISVIDLGSISPDGGSIARDVNASGVIVGHAATRKYEPDSYTHAMRWTVSESGAVEQTDLMPVLGLPAIGDASALAVNDAGTIAGVMRRSDQENYQGFVLSASGVIDVSTFPRCDGATDGTNYSNVRDINNHDEVVGEKAYIPNPSNLRGYSFYLDLRAASPCLVPLPGLSTPGLAYAINDSSVIVGESFDAVVGWAISWRKANGVWTVSKLGRDSTRAWAINIRGDVAGQFAAPSSGIDQRALLWTNSAGGLVERELGALDAATQSVANGIDSSGRVVGWAHNRQLNMRAFDWTALTGMRDLGTLGGKRASAHAVNGKRIVGNSELGTGRTITGHATLWRLP
jgi:probable HAF family extracellular repeat protein